MLRNNPSPSQPSCKSRIDISPNVNNEAKVRRSTKTEVIGKARIMSYEDLEKARRERSAKEAEKEARKAGKQPRAMSRTTVAEASKDIMCNASMMKTYRIRELQRHGPVIARSKRTHLCQNHMELLWPKCGDS